VEVAVVPVCQPTGSRSTLLVAMTEGRLAPQEVRTRTFTRVVRGYRRREVRRLLERAADDLARLRDGPSPNASGDQPYLTPEEIEEVRFQPSLGGYEMDEVDEFLDQLMVELQRASGDPTHPSAALPAPPRHPAFPTSTPGPRPAPGFPAVDVGPVTAATGALIPGSAAVAPESPPATGGPRPATPGPEPATDDLRPATPEPPAATERPRPPIPEPPPEPSGRAGTHEPPAPGLPRAPVGPAPAAQPPPAPPGPAPSPEPDEGFFPPPSVPPSAAPAPPPPRPATQPPAPVPAQPMTASEVETRSFDRGAPGYLPAHVDRFMAKAARALAGRDGETLTRWDVLRQRFPLGPRGYATAEVDAFLVRLAAQFPDPDPATQQEILRKLQEG
jgi:DivIVA domain-containing protein